MTVECPDCGHPYQPTSHPETWDCPRCSKPRKTNQKEGKK